MQKNKIIYLISTSIVTLVMLFSIVNYIFNHEFFVEIFNDLGFPAFIVYPLALAKALGLIAIWSRKSELLKEWAFAGFFFDFLLATGAHLVAADGAYPLPLFVMLMLFISYRYGKIVYR